MVLALANLESSVICHTIPDARSSFCSLNVFKNCIRWLGTDSARGGIIYDSDDLERWSCTGPEPSGKDALPIDLFIKSISIGGGTKFVPGEAIFLTGTPTIVPHAMLHNIKHNKVLHERNILVTVITGIFLL